MSDLASYKPKNLTVLLSPISKKGGHAAIIYNADLMEETNSRMIQSYYKEFRKNNKSYETITFLTEMGPSEFTYVYEKVKALGLQPSMSVGAYISPFTIPKANYEKFLQLFDDPQQLFESQQQKTHGTFNKH